MPTATLPTAPSEEALSRYFKGHLTGLLRITISLQPSVWDASDWVMLISEPSCSRALCAPIRRGRSLGFKGLERWFHAMPEAIPLSMGEARLRPGGSIALREWAHGALAPDWKEAEARLRFHLQGPRKLTASDLKPAVKELEAWLLASLGGLLARGFDGVAPLLLVGVAEAFPGSISMVPGSPASQQVATRLSAQLMAISERSALARASSKGEGSGEASRARSKSL